VERSRRRLDESLAPYSRFVRAEGNDLEEKRADLSAIRQRIGALRIEIEEDA